MKAHLNIIIPFKSDLKYLSQTCVVLARSRCSSLLHLVVISDSFCYRDAESLLISFQGLISITHLSAFSKGIYPAINQGLSTLSLGDWYVVVGAGDILHVDSLSMLNLPSECLRIPYRLLSSSTQPVTAFKSLFSGMPYCHNALFFKYCGLDYNPNLILSSDYLYWLLRLKYHPSTDQDAYAPLASGASLLFDDVNGLSSTRKTLLHLENIKVLNIAIGLHASFVYSGRMIIRLFRRLFF